MEHRPAAYAPIGHFVRFLFAERTDWKVCVPVQSRTATASPLYGFDNLEQPSLHAQRKAAEGCRTPKADARKPRACSALLPADQLSCRFFPDPLPKQSRLPKCDPSSRHRSASPQPDIRYRASPPPSRHLPRTAPGYLVASLSISKL